jgi:hypothetical protein
VVVAAVFCLVFLVMGTAFSFSTFAAELGRELKAGSGSISLIFGCAIALLYGGGFFSGLWPIGSARTEWLAQAYCSPADLSSQRARLGQFGNPMSPSAWALASAWQSATRPRLQRCSPGSTAIAGGVWYRLVRDGARDAFDARTRTMADRQRGLAGSPHHHRGATIALRPAVIADHFNGPNLAAVTGLHYTSSVLGPLIGPAAFGYSVDFWNSDLIVSCMATACLVAAGYLFATKPPQRRLRRPGICWPQPCHTKIQGFIEFQPLALPTGLIAGEASNDIRNWTAHCLTLNVAAMHSPMLLGPHPSSPPRFLGFNIAIFWVRL